MYRQGIALEAAHRWMTEERQRQKEEYGNYDHNRVDLFRKATWYSNLADTLAEHRDYLIYKVWVAELYSYGRQLEDRVNELFHLISKTPSGRRAERDLRRHLESLIALSPSTCAFERDVSECCNCLITTCIEAEDAVMSLSQLWSTIRQREHRSYELVAMKISSIQNARQNYLTMILTLLVLGVTVLQLWVNWPSRQPSVDPASSVESLAPD